MTNEKTEYAMWVESTVKLRKELLDEKGRLENRLKEIQKNLDDVPELTSADSLGDVQNVEPVAAKESSNPLPWRIMDALAGGKRRLVGEIADALGDVEAAVVNTTLARMMKDGRVKRDGNRGSFVYHVA